VRIGLYAQAQVFGTVAEYDSAAKQEDGGVHNDGEDIETVEMRLDDALDKVAAGEIRDGKTIMLLQYARLHFFA
jgi:predicted RNase H-like HicB family nuclease